jgi:hypothetical protein
VPTVSKRGLAAVTLFRPQRDFYNLSNAV